MLSRSAAPILASLAILACLATPALCRAQAAGQESAAPAGPTYFARIQELAPDLRERMTGVSWRQGCPVGLDDLRLVELAYWGMDGESRTGRLVVHKDVAQDVADIFGDLYEARFPIERMELVDEYGGDDNASMAANNTSAFNCRNVPGTSSLSRHSYGVAVDVNPLLNPYIRGSEVLPPLGEAYADREQAVPGLITAGDACCEAFVSRGWTWGGEWVNSKDYQHFQSDLP